MFKSNQLALSVKLACAVGALSTVGFAPQALAQDTNAEAAVEKIQVTGSRIRKQEFESAAPISVVSSQQFELTNTVNTESLLNTLPQVIPGFDRTANNPGDGTATVDLRGLGTSRTLVLINGTRAVPTNSSGTVDINTIPTALIKNVEVLTGGASAVYGSDAVAGVVNFILKDDFEGVEFNTGYESTGEGDADIFNTDLTIGGNFADGRGNVVLNLSYTDRQDLFQGDRDFSTFAQFDDGEGGLFDGGSSGIPGTSIFAAGFGESGSNFSPGTGVTFGQDGAIRPFVTTGDNNDFYNYAPVNYIQLPQERHQTTALASYEISRYAEVYGRAMFTDSRVPQQLAATPIFQTTTFTLDDNPFLTPTTQQVIADAGLGGDEDIDGDGIPDEATAFVRRRMLEVGPRRAEDGYKSFQFQVGMRGDLGDSGWFYDVYYQTGKVDGATSQLGNVNRDRFDQALLLATDENGDVILDADGNPSCADTSANGSTEACAPMNIFGEGNISQQAADFLKTAVASTQTFDQKIFGASVTGDLGDFFELPGGPVGIALAYESRDESFAFKPSQDLAAGTIAGFNGAPAVAGGYTVSGYSIELNLPILDGVELAELLSLDLAYRTEDYSTVGTVDAYKVAGVWAPTDTFRFRAGFNTAVRAPNIGELFSPQGEGFPGASDPCAGNGSLDQTDALRNLCIATGVPADSVFSPGLNPPSGQVRSLFGGNPNLAEESAETLTVGVVVDATDELSFSVDYFDIQVDDAISSFGGGTANILTSCYDGSVGGGAGGPFCDVINRRADGTIEFVEVLSQNVASIELAGIDVVGSYNTETQYGDVSLDYVGTYTSDSSFTPFAGATTAECAGKFGLVCGEPTPEYKHRLTAQLSKDDYTLQVLWRYIGEVNDDDDDTLYATETVDATSYFDVSGTYFLTDNYRVVVGVDNVLDEKPPIMGDNQEQANTYPATYDVFGRTFYASFRATF